MQYSLKKKSLTLMCCYDVAGKGWWTDAGDVLAQNKQHPFKYLA